MEQQGNVLALDYGKKRVGVASGDISFKIAFPRGVILNKGLDYLIGEIKKLCEEIEVSVIVVGLPLNMDYEGLENEMVTEVRYFVDNLRKNLKDIDIKFFDERLSSFEARSLMKDVNEKMKGKKLPKDAYAAQVILQRFFDKIN